VRTYRTPAHLRPRKVAAGAYTKENSDSMSACSPPTDGGIQKESLVPDASHHADENHAGALQSSSDEPRTLTEWSLRVLQTKSAHEKVALTRAAYTWWLTAPLTQPIGPALRPPVYPARPDVQVVQPGKVPRLGKGGTKESRIRILHSLAHIETWAIDLSHDVLLRFRHLAQPELNLPGDVGVGSEREVVCVCVCVCVCVEARMGEKLFMRSVGEEAGECA
jgi:Protein of unknown function (DUF455)